MLNRDNLFISMAAPKGKQTLVLHWAVFLICLPLKYLLQGKPWHVEWLGRS